MILIAGSTGRVGSEVVDQLVRAGHRVRVLVRAIKDAEWDATVDVAIGDLDNVDSLVTAMTGVDRVYMLAPLSPALEEHDQNLVAAARRAGVDRIVKHSVLGAQWEDIALARWHRAGERLVEASGAQWTFVRPSPLFDNARGWATTIRRAGAAYVATGEGKAGIVDARDVAAVAVKCLIEPGHAGKAYDVTGPDALSAREQVEAIGRAIGRPIKLVEVPPAAVRDVMHGTPPRIADALLELAAAIKAARYATVTAAVQRLTGKTPRTFAEWATENAGTFSAESR
jgi:uncharacterized protein YbjT (DUF2867 family)